MEAPILSAGYKCPPSHANWCENLTGPNCRGEGIFDPIMDESGPVADGNDFDLAVDQLLQALEVSGAEFGRPDLERILNGLSKYLQASFSGLPTSEIAELADQALMRFVQAAHAKRIDKNRKPAAYMTTIARNLALSSLRDAKRHQMLDENRSVQDLADDTIAAMLDANADESAVKAAVSRAALNGDHTTVRVITAWLDLASKNGYAPATRDVGSEAGVSHTTVQECLKRFRIYLSGR